jgi:hypothetical protein
VFAAEGVVTRSAAKGKAVPQAEATEDAISKQNEGDGENVSVLKYNFC